MSFISSNKIAEYAFVELKLFFKHKNKESCCDVILLVDEYNWIHDYKVYWGTLTLTQYTTAAHFKNNSNSFKFNFRTKLLQIIGLENRAWNKPRICKPYIDLTQDQIIKVNQLFNNEWKNQTFSNIDYVITGSNASGQGDPSRSSFYWKTKSGFNKTIGFLFQALRLKFKKSELQINEINNIWHNYNNKTNIYKHYSFDMWLNNCHDLKMYFEYFNQKLTPRQQRKKINEIKNRYCPIRARYENICNLIIKYRSNLYNKLEKEREIFIKNFWQEDFDKESIQTIEFAHIKPVCEIKRECIQNEFNENILNDVKSINNILPLDPNTHTFFDKHMIYWNLDGDLCFLIKNNCITIQNKFKKIPPNTLLHVYKFLLWYIKNRVY